jgi:hypothetical protein
MSLQLAAQHLANHGRGKDTELVHMDKGELQSLRAIAQKHGGDLSVNPHTGLPEAGFLSALLPVIAGAALGPGGFELMSATGAGLAGAAGSMLLNPKAGLMGALSAGLGAYGGANLGQALASQGVEQATAEKLANDQAYKQAIADQQLKSEALGKAFQSGSITADEFGKQAMAAANPGQTIYAKTLQDVGSEMGPLSKLSSGVSSLGSSGGFSNLYSKLGDSTLSRAGTIAGAAAPLLTQTPNPPPVATPDKDMGQRYTYSSGVARPLPEPDIPTYQDMSTKQGNFGRQQNYFPQAGYVPVSNDAAKSIYGYASGGIAAGKNPIEQMSNQNAIGANTGFPQAYLHNNAYATPYQTPMSQNVLTGPGDVGVDPYTGEQQMAAGGQVPRFGLGGWFGDRLSDLGSSIGHIGKSDGGGDPAGWAQLDTMMGMPPPQQQAMKNAGYEYDPVTQQYTLKQMASGGLSDLGSYSDGGRLLRGPGDGVSDSIPAVIGKKQPARLADGEFVVPARIVSELGNGSTEAGARKLYAMMDRIQATRSKTVGKGKVAKNSRADKYLPA